ncbi:hypothetical protein HYALB_00003250 [Hymenoscyphus albidus]|uniref:RING-type domain-containing protein n=1 Tax=Hymenoscyphus albidus TaxID=595503 RepID=A0A9N9LYG0_9HELO|nr:hypothetical protein HYALB_00003250 [Hymenoscyphus albidus]
MATIIAARQDSIPTSITLAASYLGIARLNGGIIRFPGPEHVRTHITEDGRVWKLVRLYKFLDIRSYAKSQGTQEYFLFRKARLWHRILFNRAYSDSAKNPFKDFCVSVSEMKRMVQLIRHCPPKLDQVNYLTGGGEIVTPLAQADIDQDKRMCPICYLNFTVDWSTLDLRRDGTTDEKILSEAKLEVQNLVKSTFSRFLPPPKDADIKMPTGFLASLHTITAEIEAFDKMMAELKASALGKEEYCNQPVQTTCGHIMGKDCLKSWCEQNPSKSTCPYCRVDLTTPIKVALDLFG